MSENEYRGEKFSVPESLMQVTVDTMQVEKLFVVQPDLYGEVKDTVWTNGTEEFPERIIIEGNRNVDPIEDKGGAGNIIIAMKAVVVSEGSLRSGIICDFRHFEGKVDRVSGKVDFSDQEEAMALLEGKQNERIVSAVIVADEEGNPDIWGDSAFFSAAQYMAKEVDEFYELAYKPDDVDLEPEAECSQESDSSNQRRNRIAKKLINFITRNR